jgi:primosomal protein N'
MILSWGKHVVAFQWKRYEATTRLPNLTLIEEAEKTLTKELMGCSDFVSLVVFSTSSQVRFTHLPEEAEDNGKRILVPGGSVLKHEYNPQKGKAQKEKKGDSAKEGEELKAQKEKKGHSAKKGGKGKTQKKVKTFPLPKNCEMIVIRREGASAVLPNLNDKPTEGI